MSYFSKRYNFFTSLYSSVVHYENVQIILPLPSFRWATRKLYTYWTAYVYNTDDLAVNWAEGSPLYSNGVTLLFACIQPGNRVNPQSVLFSSNSMNRRSRLRSVKASGKIYSPFAPKVEQNTIEAYQCTATNIQSSSTRPLQVILPPRKWLANVTRAIGELPTDRLELNRWLSTVQSSRMSFLPRTGKIQETSPSYSITRGN